MNHLSKALETSVLFPKMGVGTPLTPNFWDTPRITSQIRPTTEMGKNDYKQCDFTSKLSYLLELVRYVRAIDVRPYL